MIARATMARLLPDRALKSARAPKARKTSVLAALLFLSAGLAGCKHLIKVPDVGGDIHIGRETKPTGPIISSETQSGAACGPNLPKCPGTTGCFVVKDKPICTTEDAACAAAGCGSKPCQIQESYPMRAVCR